MSFAGFVALVIGINLVCALSCAFIAGRTGRDPFSWVLAGGILGPFALIALAAVAAQKPSQPASLRVQEGGHRVLVPVDGSDSSLAAVQQIIDSPARFGAVTLLTVLPFEREEGAQSEPGSPLRAEYDEAVELHLAEASRRLRATVIPFEAVVRFGLPATEILRLAEIGGFDQIVIGRRGRGLAQALLGSVSDEVAKKASMPVTIAG